MLIIKVFGQSFKSRTRLFFTELHPNYKNVKSVTETVLFRKYSRFPTFPLSPHPPTNLTIIKETTRKIKNRPS